MLTYMRQGFATNSSSSHHIVSLKNKTNVRTSHCYDMQFGWDFFTCSSRDDKAAYVIMQIMDSLPREIRETTMETRIFNKLSQRFGLPRDYRFVESDFCLPHVDHQSRWYIYKTHPIYNDSSVDDIMCSLELFCRFAKQEIVDNDNIVICGGNDNDDNSHPLIESNAAVYATIDSILSGQKKYLLKDDGNDQFTLMSLETGTKLRFAADDVKKALTPGLIDINITDWCDANCLYCYRGCSTAGRDAMYSTIQELFHAISDMDVPEIVLSGGEPTAHRELDVILKLFGYNPNLAINFSTQSYKWICNADIVSAVKTHCKAIAYSFGYYYDRESLQEDIAKAQAIKLMTNKVMYCHLILGMLPYGETSKDFKTLLSQTLNTLIDVGLNHIVLLSPKKPKKRENALFSVEYRDIFGNYDGWEEVVADKMEQYPYATFAIDNVLAKQLMTKDHKFDAHTIADDDGMYSMYYDAVRQMAAKNSFAPEDEFIPCTPREIKTVWAQL